MKSYGLDTAPAIRRRPATVQTALRVGRCLTVALICTVLALVVTCCDRPDDITPGEFQTIENAEWSYGRSVRFNRRGDTIPGVIDAIAVSVRHTNDYPYANLWMELRYRSSDSLVIDTFNIFLSDEYGKWRGSGSGPVMMYTDTVHPGKIPDADTQFALRHIMRVDVLPDIEQIGMSFHTVPDKRK